MSNHEWEERTSRVDMCPHCGWKRHLQPMGPVQFFYVRGVHSRGTLETRGTEPVCKRKVDFQ